MMRKSKGLGIFAMRKSARAAVFSLFLGLGVQLALTGPEALAQLRYDSDYPEMDYGGRPLQDAFSRALADLEASGGSLRHSGGERGYLDSLLELLDIDPSSQILVWSKTSLKLRFIEPSNPRALYYNDEVYVGFVPGSSTLEIAAMDPVLGPVFFDFAQNPDAKAPFKRELGRCLRCHDTYSMTGGGVPRLMLMSVLAGTDGNVVSHEISELTDTSTPYNLRWGGLYVTGSHGSMVSLGNFIVDSAEKLRKGDYAAYGNRQSLDEFVSLEGYLRPTSDIVSLLVLEHQVEVQNRITRLHYDSSRLLAEQPDAGPAELDPLIRPLLDSLFMAHEAPLTDEVAGSSGFREYFESLGPRDAQGRSLRELDLKTRTFRHPLSYLIGSPAIAALPEPVRRRLYAQVSAVLREAPDAVDYAHINADQRAGLLAIVQALYPEVLQ